MSWNTAIQFNKLYQAYLSLSASAIKNPLTANLNLAGYNLTSGGTITTTTLNGTNLNGKLNIVGQVTSTNGNVLYCSNTSNTTGNFDILTDSAEHFRFLGGSGIGSNTLTIGGTTYGGITIPSTSGIITANRLSSNAASALQLESGSNLDVNILAGGTGAIKLTTNSATRATIDSAGITTSAITLTNINLPSASAPLTISNAGYNQNIILNSYSSGQDPATIIQTGNNGLTASITTATFNRRGLKIYDTATGNLAYSFGVGPEAGVSRIVNNTSASDIGYQSNQLCIGKDIDRGTGNVGSLNLGFIGSDTTLPVNTAGTISSISQGVAWQPMRFYAGEGNAPLGAVEKPFSWYTGGIRIQQMNASGTFTVSDERLKNTIQPINTALETILLLKPSTFYYNTDTNKESLISGFVSQEIEPFFPHMITESKVRDDDETKYKFFNPVQLIPHLTKAIQEQQAQITSLQAQLKALAEATGHLLL